MSLWHYLVPDQSHQFHKHMSQYMYLVSIVQ